MAVEKKVNLELVGLDGNAFSLLGAFQRQARKEGWAKPEIDEVMKDATSGDYDHLLYVLNEHCDAVPATDGYEDEEEEDDGCTCGREPCNCN